MGGLGAGGGRGVCSSGSSRQAELKHAGISLQQGGTTSPQL